MRSLLQNRPGGTQPNPYLLPPALYIPHAFGWYELGLSEGIWMCSAWPPFQVQQCEKLWEPTMRLIDIKTSMPEASGSSLAVDYQPKAANEKGRDEVGQLLLALTEKCAMKKGLQPSYFKEFIWQREILFFCTSSSTTSDDSQYPLCKSTGGGKHPTAHKFYL